MDKAKKKKQFSELYRIAILNDRTLKELWCAVLSLRSLIIVISIVVVLLIGVGIVLVNFTPLREYVPGYPSANERQMLVDNFLKVDSLERAMSQGELYFDNLHSILVGKNTKSHFVDKDSIKKIDNKIAPIKLDITISIFGITRICRH